MLEMNWTHIGSKQLYETNWIVSNKTICQKLKTYINKSKILSLYYATLNTQIHSKNN